MICLRNAKANCFTVLFFCNLNRVTHATDDDYEKLNQFQKSMGNPNIYFNKDSKLVLSVTIYKGDTNRIIDSGLISVGIQLKDTDHNNINSNLINYLSQVLKVREELFSVAEGDQELKKVVTIHDDKVKPFEVIDNLVTALEITAKEDPNALKKVDPEYLERTKFKEDTLSEEDTTRIFDWRDKI